MNPGSVVVNSPSVDSVVVGLAENVGIPSLSMVESGDETVVAASVDSVGVGVVIAFVTPSFSSKSVKAGSVVVLSDTDDCVVVNGVSEVKFSNSGSVLTMVDGTAVVTGTVVKVVGLVTVEVNGSSLTISALVGMNCSIVVIVTGSPSVERPSVVISSVDGIGGVDVSVEVGLLVPASVMGTIVVVKVSISVGVVLESCTVVGFGELVDSVVDDCSVVMSEVVVDTVVSNSSVVIVDTISVVLSISVLLASLVVSSSVVCKVVDGSFVMIVVRIAPSVASVEDPDSAICSVIPIGVES